MATTLYFRADNPEVHRGTNTAKLDGTNSGWLPHRLSTGSGGGVIALPTNTVAGPTNGVEVTEVSLPVEFISAVLAADVTISGTITANLWAQESNMNANVAINVEIDVIRGSDQSITSIVKSTNATEVGTSPAVNTFTTGMTSGAYTGVACNRGDRIRIVVFGDDAGTMGSGFTFSFDYDGGTGGADGDSFIQFTENLTFESDPSGTQLFMTNVQSGFSGAPTLVTDFTGSDQNPLTDGGNWAALNPGVENELQRISNQVAGSSGVNKSYWTPADFGPDLEAYLTVAVADTRVGIAARIQQAGGAGTWDGYAVSVIGTTTTRISVYTNGVETATNYSGPTWGNGDLLGMRIEGTLIQVWRFASGGSSWNLVATQIDSTYSAAGKIGILIDNTTARADDFYAATDSNLFTQQAWTSRGSGVVSYLSGTVNGWTAPRLTNEWYTKRLTAFTLGGLAKGNLRGLESATTANASLRLEIARVDSDGSNATVWGTAAWQPNAPDGGELTTSEAARFVYVSGDDLAVSDGQRLRIRLYVDDSAGSPMGSGQSATFFFNGTSGGASGDSYITLPQSVTEFVAATSQIKAGSFMEIF